MAEKDLGCLGEPEDLRNVPQRPGSEGSHSTSSTIYNRDADIEEGTIKASKEVDRLEIFDWSGPHDPNHPHNWGRPLKLYIGCLLAIITMVVSINSSIYGTGVEQEVKEFGISRELNVLGTSLYLVGFVVGPPFWGPVSERYGRKTPMVTGLAVSGIWTIMVAAAHNVPTIMIGRFLTGIFGAAPISIVAGAATDNWNAIDRGVALAFVIGMVFSGPFFGPIIGGFVSENVSWRWTMWICVIASLVVAAIAIFTLPETFPPVALARRTKKLRKETGNANLKCKWDLESTSLSQVVNVYLIRPWRLFLTEPILVLITIYHSFIYGILYLFFTSYPIVFHETRKWGLGVSSLPYFGLLTGVLCATVITIIYTRTRFARLTRENNGQVKPENRLPMMILGGCIFPIGLFWFAWTSNPHIHWAASVCAGIPIGLGMFLVWIQCFTYLIDVYLPVANSALAANGVVRSLFGAGFPLFATAMYDRLGIAWATSLLAFLGVAMVPIPVLFYIFGERIRGWSKNSVKVTT
ncbi:MAG: hypothetical protein Q9167_001034 [Letrouitia subvulpina]